jgi:hypothetical protein
VVIPYAQSYTSTMTGRVPKLVDCEGCQQKYVYLLERSASGEGTSFLFLDNDGAKERAQERAREELTYKLERACDPVPCPRCGWYQPHMVPKAKELHKAWMWTAGMAALLLAIPLGLVAAISFGIAESRGERGAYIVCYLSLALLVLGVLLGPALLFARYRAVKAFDPNAELAEDRIARGRDRAVTLEQFAAVMAQQQEGEGKPAEPPTA